jgi:transcriptional regulator of nitric oxide reductase
MPGFFSKLKGKDGPMKTSKSKKNAQAAELPSSKPVWVDAWLRKSVEPEEIQELLHGCTMELKSRGEID